MNFLLAADLHLTDASLEDYRWEIFKRLKELAKENEVAHIYLLGDVWDRKDRHTGKLVNRLIDSLYELRNGTDLIISILAGNHDSPIDGVPYWEFLNKHEGIHYITHPEFHYNEIAVLPFSPNPIRDWKDIPFHQAKAILMHQPVQGAFVNEYRKLDKAPVLPPLPRNVPCFSGDIHRPQVLDNIIYIGVPHPVHFTEDWEHRIILIKDSEFSKYQEIIMPSLRRCILEINSAAELANYDKFKDGDQLRIRVKLDGRILSSWPVEQQQILEWAKKKGVFIASLEAAIMGDAVQDSQEEGMVEIMNPEDVIRQYGQQEKLSDDVVEMGLSFLKE